MIAEPLSHRKPTKKKTGHSPKKVRVYSPASSPTQSAEHSAGGKGGSVCAIDFGCPRTFDDGFGAEILILVTGGRSAFDSTSDEARRALFVADQTETARRRDVWRSPRDSPHTIAVA